MIFSLRRIHANLIKQTMRDQRSALIKSPAVNPSTASIKHLCLSRAIAICPRQASRLACNFNPQLSASGIRSIMLRGSLSPSSSLYFRYEETEPLFLPRRIPRRANELSVPIDLENRERSNRAHVFCWHVLRSWSAEWACEKFFAFSLDSPL